MLDQNPDFPKLARPAQRALQNAGFTQLRQLTTISEMDFSKLHGIGSNAVKALKEALASKGLSFADNDKR
ncbi:MAG: hypothetical protein ABI166_00650 [Mucilaginibacter sp.]